MGAGGIGALVPVQFKARLRPLPPVQGIGHGLRLFKPGVGVADQGQGGNLPRLQEDRLKQPDGVVGDGGDVLVVELPAHIRAAVGPEDPVEGEAVNPLRGIGRELAEKELVAAGGGVGKGGLSLLISQGEGALGIRVGQQGAGQQHRPRAVGMQGIEGQTAAIGQGEGVRHPEAQAVVPRHQVLRVHKAGDQAVVIGHQGLERPQIPRHGGEVQRLRKALQGRGPSDPEIVPGKDGAEAVGQEHIAALLRKVHDGGEHRRGGVGQGFVQIQQVQPLQREGPRGVDGLRAEVQHQGLAEVVQGPLPARGALRGGIQHGRPQGIFPPAAEIRGQLPKAHIRPLRGGGRSGLPHSPAAAAAQEQQDAEAQGHNALLHAIHSFPKNTLHSIT